MVRWSTWNSKRVKIQVRIIKDYARGLGVRVADPIAFGQASHLTRPMTRGIALPEASIALRRKRLAVGVSHRRRRRFRTHNVFCEWAAVCCRFCRELRNQ
jgi:hypothetical protein